MPVLVKATLSLEDTFQQLVVLDNTVAETEAMIADFVSNNLDEEYEIVAQQFFHVDEDFAHHACVTITEVDRATADFIVSQFGNDFGTGILHTVFGLS